VALPVACNQGAVCGVCEYPVYLSQYCIVLNTPSSSTATVAESATFKSCNYPFGPNDQTFVPTQPLAVSYRALFDTDPYVVLQRETRGSNRFDSTRVDRKPTGIALAAVGGAILLLMCVASVTFGVWCGCRRLHQPVIYEEADVTDGPQPDPGFSGFARNEDALKYQSGLAKPNVDGAAPKRINLLPPQATSSMTGTVNPLQHDLSKRASRIATPATIVPQPPLVSHSTVNRADAAATSQACAVTPAPVSRWATTTVVTESGHPMMVLPTLMGASATRPSTNKGAAATVETAEPNIQG